MRLLFVSLVLGLCVPPSVDAGANPDFSRYVALGDGFTAGFRDGALSEEGQSESYVAIVSAAMGNAPSLPLIAMPGVPEPNPVSGIGLLIKRPGTCEYGQFDLATGRSIGRIDQSLEPRNVAVPYQTIVDATAKTWNITPGNPNDPDSFEDFVLGYPASLTSGTLAKTQLQTAIELDPTFASVWLGNMDALLAVVSGTVNDNTLTQQSEFARRVDQIFDALEATGAKGVVVNIPNVTASAYLLTPKDVKDRTRYNTKQLKKRLGVLKSSYVVLSAIPTLDAIRQGQATGPLAANQILTKQELAKIQSNIVQYNKELKKRADALGWAYVDLNELFDRYEKRGITIDGVGTLSTRYLGGLYSLDGIHPSRTGQALIAVAVLSAINQKYGSSLPLPNVNAIAASDPLVCMVQ